MATTRRTLGQLLQQGWNEIPEVIASSGLAIVGVGLAALGYYNYTKDNGDNKRFMNIGKPHDTSPTFGRFTSGYGIALGRMSNRGYNKTKL